MYSNGSPQCLLRDGVCPCASLTLKVAGALVMPDCDACMCVLSTAARLSPAVAA